MSLASKIYLVCIFMSIDRMLKSLENGHALVVHPFRLHDRSKFGETLVDHSSYLVGFKTDQATNFSNGEGTSEAMR